jgi:hypothetical protein
VPLIIGDDLDCTRVDDYRASMISSCFFQGRPIRDVLCAVHAWSLAWLQSDEPQFGFKKNRDVLYTVHGVVEHLNNNNDSIRPFFVLLIFLRHLKRSIS